MSACTGSGRMPSRVPRATPASLALAALCFPLGLHAGEFAPASPLEDGGFLEIGVTVASGTRNREQLDPDDNDEAYIEVSPFISGAWRRGRWFAEGVQGSLDGASLGATVWHDGRWALDLLGVGLAGNIDVELDGEDPPAGTTRRDEALLERDSLFLSSGFRIRRYLDAALLQGSAMVDWHHGNGVAFGVHAGWQWQTGNWNTQLLVGARHASAALADHIWGVDEDEATARFPAYQVPDTTFAEMQLGASRALGEDWVFGARLRGRRFESGLLDSPLVSRPGFVVAETSIAYVF